MGNAMCIVDAAKCGNTKKVLRCLSEGQLVDEIKEGFTPLSRAARFGHTEVVRLLLDKGADIDRYQPGALRTEIIHLAWYCQDTPLMLSVLGGHRETAVLLLDRGANVNRLNLTFDHKMKPEKGWNALVYAAFNEDSMMFNMLLLRGARLESILESDAGPYFQLVSANKVRGIGIMLDAGICITAENHYGRTLLMLAALDDNLEIVTYLLGRSTKGQEDVPKALRLAVTHGYSRVVNSIAVWLRLPDAEKQALTAETLARKERLRVDMQP